MSKQSDAVKAWRKRTKKRMINAFGGGCSLCEYSTCNAALEFHHLDPNEKDFSISSATAHPKKWEILVEELRKCICVCRNCHAEIHNNVRQIPTDVKRFDEEYAKYQKSFIVETEPCPVCGKEKPTTQINCSRSCAGKSAGKVDWENVNLVKLLNIYNGNLEAVGRKLNITGAAVRKRKIKLGLI